MSEENIANSKLSLLLEEYVGSEGGVDYGSLGKEGTVEKYVEWLAGFDPDSLKDQDERLAFWINTYNTLTLAGVLRELARNKDFAKKGNRSRTNRVKFFWRRKYKIGGKDYTLYQIENAVLRKEFSEPRIHFALNCGSASCPILKDGLYSAETLNEELDAAATIFIRSPRGSRLDREGKILHLSSIFKWYKEDFEKNTKSVLDFVKRYMTDEDRRFVEEELDGIKIKYQQYDWGLNISS